MKGGLLQLTVLRGVQVGERLPLPDAPRVVVGRDPDTDVRLVGPQVSRRHFAIERDERGLWLRDLGSGNGTYLNGRRVLEAALADGDRIAVGDVECEFHAPAATAEDRTVLLLEVPDGGEAAVVEADLAAEALASVGPEALPPRRLAELAAACGEETRLDRLCHRALETCRAALGADRGALVAIVGEAGDPNPIAVLPAPGDPPALWLGVAGAAVREIAVRRRAVRLVRREPRPQAAILVGLPAGPSGHGVLYLGRDTPPAEPFGDRDVAAATALAAIVAAALGRVWRTRSRETEDGRMRLLVEGWEDLVFALDDGGRVTYANRALPAGPDGDRGLRGRRLVDLLPAPDQAGVLAAIDRALDAGTAAVVETALRRAGDGFLPVRLRLSPLRNPMGTIVGVGGVARDHREVLALRQRADPASLPSLDRATIVGESAAMREARALLADAGGHDRPVVVVGEGGTGKSAVARAIHAGSAQAAGPFVTCSCGALPEVLLEAALFGDPGRPGASGHLAAAARGTLFLRDITELPPALQARLASRLAPRAPVPDVRVIASSPVALDALVAEATLRAELAEALAGAAIALPPLRERREDIPLLVAHALNGLAEEGRRPLEVAPEAMERLVVYDWPGNVRELQAELANGAGRAEGATLRVEDLSTAVRGDGARGEPADARETLARVLDAARGDPDRAAALLGVPRSTFVRRLRARGLGVPAPGT